MGLYTAFLLTKMLSAHVILAVLLLIVVIEGRANYVQNRRIASKLGLEHPGICSILMDGCPAVTMCDRLKPQPVMIAPVASSSLPNVSSAAPAGTTSGFSSTDPLAHAREMDARKLRIGSSSTPAKKIETMMMETDSAQRKMRAALMRGG